MRSTLRMAAVALTALAATACQSGDPVQLLGTRNGELVISVTAGGAPTYSWTGEPARSLTVRESGGDLFWRIEALDGSGGFASPVDHGATPQGARVTTEARLLQSGVRYQVIIVTVDGSEGLREFVP